jgi:hypothetical protein
MFATNLVLLLAFVAMIAGAVWLFRDGEGKGPRAPVRLDDEDNAERRLQVRVPDADADADADAETDGGRSDRG